MSGPTKYLLVSLPTSISTSSDKEEALTALRSTVSSENVTVSPFKIPEFKIGTLDALVQQADDLAKLEGNCEAVVAKVGDSLRFLLEGDEDKIIQQKTVNDKPADQYLRTFTWNKVKYRADKPLAELIDSLQKELVSIDNDVKAKLAQYTQVKTNLTTLQRKQTGNLSTKSLTPVVDPSLLIQDSEYLETHLIVVPNNAKKDFIRSYETLSPMVVPRSSIEVTHDDDFTLFAVTTFKKHSAEFQHKCREQKWTPRDYKYIEGGKEEERKEIERVSNDERKIWGEALRLGRTGWSESVMIWVHVLTLRVFVETVLRYGLPLDFVCGLIKTSPKVAVKVKKSLDSAYSYLGGNAFGRDKKGNITKDNSALSSEMSAAGVGAHGGEGNVYTAYVYYDFDII
jgi:V-type H+-transporting ATPase subunit C